MGWKDETRKQPKATGFGVLKGLFRRVSLKASRVCTLEVGRLVQIVGLGVFCRCVFGGEPLGFLEGLSWFCFQNIFLKGWGKK